MVIYNILFLFTKEGFVMKKQKDELYYANEISYLIRQCWKECMNEAEIFKELTRYLKRLRLDKEKHPYLVEFKKTMLGIKKFNYFTKDEIGKQLTDFYQYKNKLLEVNKKDAL